MYWRYVYLFIVVVLAGSCSQNNDLPGGDGTFVACKYSQPEAIFSLTTPTVLGHKFVIKDDSSIEDVRFENGTNLEIIQSGCNNIRQEYLLHLEGTLGQEAPEFWLRQAVNLFYNLGDISEEYAPMLFWAEAIANIAEDMKLGQSYEVQPGISVKVDKLVEAKDGLLVVILEQTI